MMFRRVLSVLCLMAMLAGCLIPAALASGAAETRIVTVEWRDENNYDGIRPDSVTAELDGQSVVLNSENGWTGLAEGTGDWVLPNFTGYIRSIAAGDVTQVIYSHKPAKTSYTATATWEDNGDAKGVRPASVQVRLMANGKPYGVSATLSPANGWTTTWANLPLNLAGETAEIAYSAEQVSTPAYYAAASTASGVAYTLETGSLKIEDTATGLPEDVNAGEISMTVTGPDPQMPLTLTLSQFENGSYTLSDLLPGAYLILETNAIGFAEGCALDAAESVIGDAVMVKNGETATAKLKNAYIPLEEVNREAGENPTESYAGLSFEIIGPDSRMPMTVTYSQFTGGRFELGNLTPGTYAVIERNAGVLVTGYMLQNDSVTGAALTVTADGTATAALYNHYAAYPTAAPSDETVDIPVTKVWSDNGNQDGNRPGSVTVRLFADGAEVATAELSEATGWTYVFEGLPRYNERNEAIRYTVNEDPVTWYVTSVNGNTITNTYTPEVTSVSVRKVWDDNNNAAGRRPGSITMVLSNGTTVVLSEANGWSATVNNLPTRINGEPVTYSWREMSALGYTLTDVTQDGSTMVFTNSLWSRPEVEDGVETPKVPGETWYVFDEYETPLGVEVMINHVGDCFD